ncbi:Epoxide hydrolase [Penicillium riverlandense]|uniref:Epoxide hydrolase n=1 Tax=Penicillium riverlandense TaxID=1903569 RepID=UPI002547ED64|nr:Epoxide hydrolase [Penicillium riverlandense]KAJ5832499.1 Epoxide hydrolase [Penicillium riverlandense]
MATNIDKINAQNDDRVRRCTAQSNGKTYSYLEGIPAGSPVKGTIFLDAPNTVESYSYRSLTEDAKELAAQLKVERVIACGHDWGANIAYRLALWHPSLVSLVIAIRVPYFPSQGKYTPLEELSKTVLPNFTYQLQFKSGELERWFWSRDDIRSFLVAMYGGRDNQGSLAWDAYFGLMIDKVAGLKPSELLTDEEMDFYVDKFQRHVNYYRTREINHYDEVTSLTGPAINVPVLFIPALQD